PAYRGLSTEPEPGPTTPDTPSGTHTLNNVTAPLGGLGQAARPGRGRVGIIWAMDEARELTEDEVNDLLSDDDRDAAGEGDEYEWVQ
ncbi:hypothetical protein, partial [Streptomyces sp. NPDC053720]|uniref:hypothetical protein n=1 Tax=Streptomyces sp. NPDC053720 TaxID=3154855 RepID=UPI00342C7D2D